MNEPPIRDERIIEAIEACRPGRDDVGDPALADLAAELAVNPDLAKHFERLQQCDANLGSAFRSVPVPDGLDQRLLARLQQAGGPSQGEEEHLSTDVATALRPKRLSRRWVLAAGGVAAVAAVLVIAATVYLYNSRPYSRASVLEDSVAFFQVESPNPGEGELVDRSPPPETYPFSRSVGRVPRMRWRSIGGFLGRAGIAYDLPVCDQATLYVVRRTVADLETNPPLRPQKNTGGFSAATWQEGKLLYVLVLHGNNSSSVYRNLVDLPHGPLL